MPKCIFCCDGAELPPGEWCRCCDRGRTEAAFEASIDEEIARIEAMSPDELDAELRAQGLDPAKEAARVKALIMDAIARHHDKQSE